MIVQGLVVLLPHGRRRFDVVRDGYRIRALFESSPSKHALEIAKKPVEAGLPRERERAVIETSISQGDDFLSIGNVYQWVDITYTRKTLGGAELEHINGYAGGRSSYKFNKALVKARALVDSLTSVENTEGVVT